MLRSTFLLVFLLVCFTHSSSSVKPLKPLKVDYQAEFTWDFYKKMSSGRKQNTVISPYSLRKIFACIQQLTDLNDPATANFDKQLKTVFHLEQKNHLQDLTRRRYAAQWKDFEHEKGLNASTLAALIGRQGVTRNFKNLSKNCTFFTKSISSGSPKQMSRVLNGIMRNISNGSVNSFLSASDIDRDEDFFVLDSWKFNGLWRYQFDEEHTTTCDFYSSANQKSLMRFMYLEEKLKFGYFPPWNVQAVELPFHSESPFSSVLMIPIGVDIVTLIKRLNHDIFTKIYSMMSATKTVVRLPQFKLKSKLTAKSVLPEYGFNDAFNKPLFNVFEDKSGVPLGDVIQKLEIVFGHEGEQEANAYLDRSLGNQFTANQPFVFIIFEKSELVPVIVGHVIKAPTSTTVTQASDERLCDHPPKYLMDMQN